MIDRYPLILQTVREQPWLITPAMLERIVEIVEHRAAGGRFTAEEIEARIGPKDEQPGPAVARMGSVGVLALHGVMAQRMNLFMQISGGTSTELFGQAFDAAIADPEVQAIVISIDSPGGSVFGVEELATKIYRSRGAGKPIVAVADAMAASAAFWVGAQAHQVVVTPSGMVGSIGVVVAHTDVSKADESRGVKTTLVAIPAGKVTGHPYEPLSDESRAAIEARIAPYYDAFVKAVARGRGVSVDDVRGGYGLGDVLAAAPAKKAGMVDRIESLADVIARLQAPGARAAVLNSVSRATSPTSEAEATAQEPEKATAQEPQTPAMWRELLRTKLDTL